MQTLLHQGMEVMVVAVPAAGVRKNPVAGRSVLDSSVRGRARPYNSLTRITLYFIRATGFFLLPFLADGFDYGQRG